MTIQLHVPDDLRDKIAKRAEESGQSVEQYLQSLIRADADDEDYGSPESVSVRSHDDLVRKLDEAIASGPATPMTRADWAALRKNITDRFGR